MVFTNAKGEFGFTDIPVGEYRILIGRIGYETLDTVAKINSDINLNFVLEVSDVITSDVVITGTRTYKYIENLPMPVEVVSQNKIKEQGYLRLDEVLSQEIGIPLAENLGKGMQVQGLDADYMHLFC
jgi:outer membrane receptor for ferric coprogen and ferric-rhodotorulic acid